MGKYKDEVIYVLFTSTKEKPRSFINLESRECA